MKRMLFFHALQDGRIQELSWDDYLKAYGKRKDWLLGWATSKFVLFVKNGKSIGSISFEAINEIQKKAKL
jgi:hypothetical protein